MMKLWMKGIPGERRGVSIAFIGLWPSSQDLK